MVSAEPTPTGVGGRGCAVGRRSRRIQGWAAGAEWFDGDPVNVRSAVVAALLRERSGLQRMQLDDGSRAYVLTQLTGPVAVGDEVLVNTTAVDLGLGTGGWHVVVWNRSRDQLHQPGPGHIMKLRYTPSQLDTGAAEEDGPEPPAALDGMPVVVASLHSQVAPVVVAARAAASGLRVAYVMTDGAALPLALSDLVAAMAERGLLDVTITAGHAFGGDLEAVNVPSALTLARHRAGADVAVVAMGPGVVGTGTKLGTTALEAAPALDAAAALGGTPVACLRWSTADQRERHRGLSHHSATVLELVRSKVDVPVPAALVPDVQAGASSISRHHLVSVDAPDLGALLAEQGLEVSTMGRGPDQEPEFFALCGAAGTHAAAVAGS